MRRPGVRVIDLYLLREVAAPFVFSLGLFTFFLLIDRIYHLTELVVTKGVPLYLVVGLLGLTLPSFMAQTLPMALLVAVLLAGGRLAGDLEIVAFKAAGISILRLVRPVLMAAAVVAALVATLTLWLTPIANREFQRQLFRILQSRAVAGIKERVFNTTFGDVVIYVEDVSPSQVALRGLLVSDERDPKLTRIITATEGRLLSDEVRRRITLRLLNGAVNEADVMPANPPPQASTETLPPGGAAANTRYRYTKFTLYDMTLTVDTSLRGTRVDKPEKTLTLGELDAEMRRLQAVDPRGVLPFVVEWHKRCAQPFAAIVFCLVAFPLAVRSHRGGRSIALLGSLSILVSYYLLGTSLEGMALNQRVPAVVAIWATNVFFLVIGTLFIIATTREWRWPSPPFLWAALDAIRRRLPRLRRLFRTLPLPASRRSTHLVDRYVVREHVLFIAIGLGVAATLFVIVDLFQTLDRFLRLKPPMLYILEHFLYGLPAALHEGMPTVMLVATILLFLMLNRYHELTAMKAAGVSIYRVSAPVLLLGFAVAIGAALFQELALPFLNERGEEVDRVKIRGQLPRHLQSQQRLWLRSSESRFYRVELLAPVSSDLYGITVLDIDRDFRVVSRVDARRAHWTPAGWNLYEGAFRDVDVSGKVRTAPFDRAALEMPETMDDFTRIQKPVNAMSYRELRDYVVRLEAAGYQVRKYLVVLYAKLSLPLGNLVMVLVAIPFAVNSPRSGRLFGVGLAIAIMAGYLVVHYVAVSFARADLLPPILAAWSANIIFLGIGISLFARVRT